MKREDLRSKIIPTTLRNTNESHEIGNEEFNTTDKIYIGSYYEEYGDIKSDEYYIYLVEQKKVSATDVCIISNGCISYVGETRTGKPTIRIWQRSAYTKEYVELVDYDGSDGFEQNYDRIFTNYKSAGLCPSLHYQLPNESKETEQLDIKEVKDRLGNVIDYTLQIGEYPITKVNENLNSTLESLYNGGKLKEGILCTGRWYSGNGQKEEYRDYAGKHSPEFEYQGNRYARIVSYPNDEVSKYPDGTPVDKEGTIRWAKVEPISFVIKNWYEMPKSINPEGNGKAEYFDLSAEEALISNIPFYPDPNDQNSTMWQNSIPRGFLNGIDVRNIKSNGNVEYGASRGGNFTGECNFLNEAFNLSREPMIEYTIPDSETEIPDDAFNGCITLKKIVIHSEVKSIGKRAFDGLQFKYAYKTKTGELVFSQELPKDKNEYTDVVDLSKMAKSFDGFDYSIFLPIDKLSEISDFSEFLDKNKFSIPYVYALELVRDEKIKSFTENSDFRFFRNEIPKINDMLKNFPEKERLSFFKFANSLGCFSKELMLDKKGKETEVPLAQRASSLLAIILKTDEIKLR